MRIAVVQYPGSNADFDALHAARDVLGADAFYVFHKERELGAVDGVIVPGGFSYGDYLRPGAIAGFSPISPALKRFAEAGGPVLGICNGFQILTELGLLPGALTRNEHLRFECRDVHLRVEARGAFTDAIPAGTVLRLPIAHADGRYQCDDATLAALSDRVAFRYADAEGNVATPGATDAEGLPLNPNGSREAIAGIYNEGRNVCGLMPHPERAAESVLGSDDGLRLFLSLRDTHGSAA
ncbi:MAG: phosphoribosylformylglycinamidine synthase subunit PurQ [Myxococcota bacterium]